MHSITHSGQHLKVRQHNFATALRQDSAPQVLPQGGGTKYVGTLSGVVQGANPPYAVNRPHTNSAILWV